MEFSIDTVGKFGTYSLWFGCLLASYHLYPSYLAYLYILFAILVTVIIFGFMLMVSNYWGDVEGDSELENEFKNIINNVHIPCGSPKTCERCSGFYWGFAVSGSIIAVVLAAAAFILGNTSPKITYSGKYISTVGFSGFILSISGHGLLNALIKLGYAERLDFLVADRAKLLAGFIAGLSFDLIGLGIFLYYI